MAILAGAWWLALAVRFDFALRTPAGGSWITALYLPLLPLVLVIHLAVGLALGLLRGASEWRYTSLGDALRLLVGSILASSLTIAAYNGLQLLTLLQGRHAAFTGLPETVFVLNGLFGIMLLGGVRITARLIHEESRPVAAGGITRLLIIGAGDAAAAVLREIARMPERHYRVAGLLDDDPAKARRRLQGSPVLGPISSLPRMCREHQIGEILIAMPSASSLEMQRIISLCRATQMEADVHGTATSSPATPLRFRTVPSLQDILAGKAQVNQIREVSVDGCSGAGCGGDGSGRGGRDAASEGGAGQRRRRKHRQRTVPHDLPL